ncbi:MAG TPA: 50S ribosomal protein L25 [Acidimicrobiales bacterium]|nr:50S ribosomal protein L25 [Acidimicrobiales bacterium]
MPEIVLEAQVGRSSGSRAARRLRREGLVPGTVYGHGAEPVSVTVGARELRNALSGDAGTNALLSLQAGNKTYLTLARELQRHPVKGSVTHVDFQIVRRDQIISAEIPVNLIGEAMEVQHGDGMVEQQLFTLPVRAFPADIPNFVELDISGLTIGAFLRVADLQLPEAVTVDIDPEVTVAAGLPPRLEIVEAVVSEEGVAEGEAAVEGGAEEGESPSDSSGDEG